MLWKVSEMTRKVRGTETPLWSRKASLALCKIVQAWVQAQAGSSGLSEQVTPPEGRHQGSGRLPGACMLWREKSFHLLLLGVQAKLGEGEWQCEGFSLPVCLFISLSACSFSKHVFTVHYMISTNLGADERNKTLFLSSRKSAW